MSTANGSPRGTSIGIAAAAVFGPGSPLPQQPIAAALSNPKILLFPKGEGGKCVSFFPNISNAYVTQFPSLSDEIYKLSRFVHRINKKKAYIGHGRSKHHPSIRHRRWTHSSFNAIQKG
jgi:hypothetical protein